VFERIESTSKQSTQRVNAAVSAALNREMCAKVFVISTESRTPYANALVNRLIELRAPKTALDRLLTNNAVDEN
jgi:hypothetical protein